jgi:hypothetical protein
LRGQSGDTLDAVIALDEPEAEMAEKTQKWL